MRHWTEDIGHRTEDIGHTAPSSRLSLRDSALNTMDTTHLQREAYIYIPGI